MSETEIVTRIDIDAPCSVVWSVLTDFEGFHAWNPMVTSATGAAIEGGEATLHYRSNLGIPLRFNVRITAADAPRELRWVGSSLGVSGEHYFQLSGAGAQTHLVHGEVFRGLLAGPLGFVFRAQIPVFESFNEALKRAAQARVRNAGQSGYG
jgi:hypothetical protein